MGELALLRPQFLGSVCDDQRRRHSGSCGEGHVGRLVGDFFTKIQGKIEFKPAGMQMESFPRFRDPDRPVWHPGGRTYNTQHLWCCEMCNEGEGGKLYPTTFALLPTCTELGTDDAGHPGGLCSAQEGLP